jgi:hypothetical protein
LWNIGGFFERGKCKQLKFRRFFAANFAADSYYIFHSEKIAANFAGKTSPAKVRQQIFASYFFAFDYK